MTTVSSPTGTHPDRPGREQVASAPRGYRRSVAAAGLVAAAVSSIVWTVTSPEFPDGYEARLGAIAETGTTGLISAAFFAASQLPMLVAILAIAHLARPRSPRAAAAGLTLGVLGVIGHAVFGGISLVSVVMAGDTANRAVHAEILATVESTPAIMMFAVAGLLGTVLGLLVLSIALYRSRAVAPWIPMVLWLFLVVEFVGTGLSDYATYVAGACLLIAFAGLARAVTQTSASDW